MLKTLGSLLSTAVISLFLGNAACAPASAQEYKQPASNTETGVSIDQFIGSWERSEPTTSHGTLIERAILRAGNPYQPGPPGAVLEFHKSLSVGTLLAGRRTEETEHPEREVLYIEAGTGRVESGDNFWPLAPGYAALIPPHVKHVLVSDSKEPLVLLLLTDAVEPSASPGNTVLVRNSTELPYVEKHAHWNYFPKLLFGPKDGLNPQTVVVLVEMFPMTIGAPHAHVPHWEEVWCKLPPGSSYAFLGSEVREQHPNEAFVVPPNGKTVHSVVNLTTQPMSWFYFARDTVKEEPPDWAYKVPSVPSQKIQK